MSHPNAPENAARSFGRVAEAYDRGRPTYPREAIAWLTGEVPLSVLELGAGTGKLTEVLLDLGHEVFATDPDDAMLDVLSRRFPDVRATVGTAEQIPTGNTQYDVVIAGQAFHWFDLERALPEIVRVLRPGGVLALTWNVFDDRIPWVRKLARLLDHSAEHDDPSAALDDSALFTAVEPREFKHRQVIRRTTVQDLALAQSAVASLAEPGRDAKVAEVLDFYDDYGRGMDGMQLPYETRCFRAQVLPHALREPEPEEEDARAGADAESTLGPAAQDRSEAAEDDGSAIRIDDSPFLEFASTDTAERLPRVLTSTDGDDDGTVLIDFR